MNTSFLSDASYSSGCNDDRKIKKRRVGVYFLLILGVCAILVSAPVTKVVFKLRLIKTL